MKKIIFITLLMPLFLLANEADFILLQAQKSLPKETLELSGTLRIRTPNGSNKFIHSIDAILKFGDKIPSAKYNINGKELLIEWHKNKPVYTFSDPLIKISDEISSTKMSWDELSLGFLWWKNSKIIKTTKKINRLVWLIEIPNPNNLNTLMVWIDKEMLIPLEVQSISEKNRIIKTLRVKRFRKINEVWFPQQIEILHHKSEERSILWIDEINIINE